MRENDVILLIEDNPTDAMLVKAAFDKAGAAARFFTLNDGEAAMAYFSGAEPYSDRTKYPLPQLLLLDLRMPRVSGLELLTWLRAQPYGAQLPVIVLTESSYDKDIRDAYRLGAKTFLTKPFAPDDFSSALKYTTDYWFHGDQLPASPPYIAPPASGPSGGLPASSS